MANNPGTWLDPLLNKNIASSGTVLPTQPTLNFLGNAVTVVDNPTLGTTDVSISATGLGASTLTLANGTNSNATMGTSLLQTISGPTASFALGGVRTATPANGSIFVFDYAGSQPWYFIHQDPSATGGSFKFNVPGALTVGQKIGPFFGKVQAHFDGTSLNVDLGAIHLNTYDARQFGCFVDGATDDTTNFAAGLLKIQGLAQVLNAAGFGGAFEILIPGTLYTGPQKLSNCTGVTIRGVGRGQSGLYGTAASAGLDLLTLTNCQDCTVRDLALSGYNGTVSNVGAVSKGATSLTANFGLPATMAGRPISILRHDEGCAEMITMSTGYAGSTSLTFSTGTARAWANKDFIGFGSRAAVMVYNDVNASGYLYNSSHNTLENLTIGASSVCSCIWGIAFDHGVASDLNNDFHKVKNVKIINAAVAGVHINGQNSLDHEFYAVDMNNCPVGYEALGGGCARLYGGSIQANQVDFLLGSAQNHEWQVHGTWTESNSTLLSAPATAGLNGLRFRFFGYDKKGFGGQTKTQGSFSGTSVQVGGTPGTASLFSVGDEVFICDPTPAVKGEFAIISSITPGDRVALTNDVITFSTATTNSYSTNSTISKGLIDISGTLNRVTLVGTSLCLGAFEGLFVKMVETTNTLQSSLNFVGGDTQISGWIVDNSVISFAGDMHVLRPIPSALGVLYGQEVYRNGGRKIGNPSVGNAPIGQFYQIGAPIAPVNQASGSVNLTYTARKDMLNSYDVSSMTGSATVVVTIPQLLVNERCGVAHQLGSLTSHPITFTGSAGQLLQRPDWATSGQQYTASWTLNSGTQNGTTLYWYNAGLSNGNLSLGLDP